MLIERVEEMLEKDQNRITNFVNWLKDNDCQIIYDNKMTTKDSVTKQIALYFAAKDLVSERIDKGLSIIGASIKCQPELSIDYAVTGCLIPTFLPFSSDSEAEQSGILLIQPDKTGTGFLESAFTVKRYQVRLKIDMKPFSASLLCSFGSVPY